MVAESAHSVGELCVDVWGNEPFYRYPNVDTKPFCQSGSAPVDGVGQ